MINKAIEAIIEKWPDKSLTKQIELVIFLLQTVKVGLSDQVKVTKDDDERKKLQTLIKQIDERISLLSEAYISALQIEITLEEYVEMFRRGEISEIPKIDELRNIIKLTTEAYALAVRRLGLLTSSTMVF